MDLTGASRLKPRTIRYDNGDGQRYLLLAKVTTNPFTVEVTNSIWDVEDEVEDEDL